MFVGSTISRADVTWQVSSGDWSVAGNWGGVLPTGTDTAYVVNGGTVAVSQPSETCGTLSLGSNAGSGSAQMTGGCLSVILYEYVGNSGTGTFAQSGGTNSGGYLLVVGNSAGSSGTYNLNGSGLLWPTYEYVGNSGTGTFTQSGGTNNISQDFILGCGTGSTGVYSLSGSGRLQALAENISLSADAAALFQQTGGANTVSLLSIGGNGTYLLAGGTLQVCYSLLNHGIFAGGGTSATLSGSGIWDLSGGTLQNLGSISVSIGVNSLLIVPPGFNPPTAFASYSCLGLTHTIGTTLTLPAGQGFVGDGTISDPVNCQGTITGSINLSGGLMLSGTGTVSLGSGSLSSNGRTSGISGGSLAVRTQYVGNCGTGTFTQSGGTNDASGLYLGAIAGDSGTYDLSGSGRLSTWEEYLGCSGTGTFTQSGGIHNSGFLYIGQNYGSNGTYSLTGNGQLWGSFEYVGYFGTGTFTQSGGTNYVADTLSLGGYLGNTSGTYNFSGGLLQLFALAGGTHATFNFSGGTIQASYKFSTNLPLTLGTSGGGATFDTNGYPVTLSGSLSGPGSLTKVDSGALILSASNAYTGDTLVNEGMLTIDYPCLAAGSNAWIDNSGLGGILDLNYSGADNINALYINGVEQAGGIWGSPGSGAPNTSSYLAGSGLLDVAVPEPNTLTLLATGALGLLAYAWRRRAARRTSEPLTFDQPDAPAILCFPSHAAPRPDLARRAA